MGRRAVTGPLVLGYHAVSATWPAALSITPRQLEAQLGGLVRRGYRGATFSDIALGRVTGKALAVTFDDAYRSVIELGLPILERFGLAATVFAPTDFVGRPEPMAWEGIDHWLGGPHEHELVCMSWNELVRLREAGWEVGSHTRSHPRLTALTDEELARELTTSREDCREAIGEDCTSIAYPYGDYDERVVEAAGRAGYSAGCTLPAVLHRERALAWPRVGVYHVDSGWRFRLKTSPVLRGLRGRRVWRLLRSDPDAAGVSGGPS